MKYIKLFENWQNNKELLFQLLKKSTEVKKADHIWSPNSSVGAHTLWTNYLDTNDFFDTSKNIFDIIQSIWPYEKEEYLLNWANLYYGLVTGYNIKDQKSNRNCLIQITRLPTQKECEEKSLNLEVGNEQFTIYVNPDWTKNIEGSSQIIDDEIYNIFGIENTTSSNDSSFYKLSKELKDKLKTVEDVKSLFYYLDAIV